MKKLSHCCLILGVAAACGSQETGIAPADTTAEVTIDTSAPVATVDAR